MHRTWTDITMHRNLHPFNTMTTITSKVHYAIKARRKDTERVSTVWIYDLPFLLCLVKGYQVPIVVKWVNLWREQVKCAVIVRCPLWTVPQDFFDGEAHMFFVKLALVILVFKNLWWNKLLSYLRWGISLEICDEMNSIVCDEEFLSFVNIFWEQSNCYNELTLLCNPFYLDQKDRMMPESRHLFSPTQYMSKSICGGTFDLRGRIDIEATLRLMVALTQKVYFFRNCDLSNVSCQNFTQIHRLV